LFPLNHERYVVPLSLISEQLLHTVQRSSKFSGAKQWRASSASYPSGFAQQEELAGTRDTLLASLVRDKSVDQRAAMTIPEGDGGWARQRAVFCIQITAAVATDCPPEAHALPNPSISLRRIAPTLPAQH